MYTIKTMNAISPVGLAKLPANQFEINNEADDAQGILVRSADLHDVALPKSLLAIARAGAGTNNIPIDQCTEQGIVVFNTPGANANAVAELVELMQNSKEVLQCYHVTGAYTFLIKVSCGSMPQLTVMRKEFSSYSKSDTCFASEEYIFTLHDSVLSLLKNCMSASSIIT